MGFGGSSRSRGGGGNAVSYEGVTVGVTYIHENEALIGGSLESPKWLNGSFCPKILDRWWGPTKAICHSVNVDVVGWYLQVLRTPQHYMSQWNLLELFCTESQWGMKN